HPVVQLPPQSAPASARDGGGLAVSGLAADLCGHCRLGCRGGLPRGPVHCCHAADAAVRRPAPAGPAAQGGTMKARTAASRSCRGSITPHWISKTLAGGLAGLSLAFALLGITTWLSPEGVQPGDKAQVVMWLVPPVWMLIF